MLCFPPGGRVGYSLWGENIWRGGSWRRWGRGSSSPWEYPDRWRPASSRYSGRFWSGTSPEMAKVISLSYHFTLLLKSLKLSGKGFGSRDDRQEVGSCTQIMKCTLTRTDRHSQKWKTDTGCPTKKFLISEGLGKFQQNLGLMLIASPKGNRWSTPTWFSFFHFPVNPWFFKLSQGMSKSSSGQNLEFFEADESSHYPNIWYIILKK